MRVVVVTTSFPAHAGDPSGHFVRASALELAAAGHEVHVLAPGVLGAREPSTAGAARGSLVVHRLGGESLFGWPGAASRARESPWRLLAALPFALRVRSRLAALGRFDRAVAHWMVPSGWPLLALTGGELEVVAHGGDVRAMLAAPARLRRHVIGSLLARDARFTFAAEASLSRLAAALDPPLAAELRRRARVRLPAIELPDPVAVRVRGANLRRAAGIDPETRLVAVVGRLVAGKRVALALAAHRERTLHGAGAGSRCACVIVGDGPERARLEAEARRPGAGTVVFTGTVCRDEALAWIACADVLLHPSAEEAAPSVVREARALGVAVVACPSGDLEAWARLDPGIALSAPAPSAFASALRAALAGAPSRAQRSAGAPTSATHPG